MKKDKFKVYQESLEDAEKQYNDSDLITKKEYDLLIEDAQRILKRRIDLEKNY